MNSFILSSLRTYVRPDQLDWPTLLPGIMMAYRHTPATNSTEFSPFYILFNQTMRTPLDTEIDGQVSDVPVQYRFDLKSYIKGVQVSRNIAKQNIERHQKVSKSYHDQRSSDAEYVINDLVWVYNPEVPVGLSRKLRRMGLGPFRVSAIGPNHTYRLQNCETLEILTSLVNACRLKPVVGHQHSAIRHLVNNRHAETQVGRLGANETNSSQPNARASQNLVPSTPAGVSSNTSRARLRRKPGESPREEKEASSETRKCASSTTMTRQNQVRIQKPGESNAKRKLRQQTGSDIPAGASSYVPRRRQTQVSDVKAPRNRPNPQVDNEPSERTRRSRYLLRNK